MVQSKTINVLMIGPDTNVKGGISSVEKLILKYIPKNINYIFIPTMKEGSNLYKIFVFFIAIIKIIFTLGFKEVDIVHINLSKKGSIFRKSIVSTIAVLLNKKYIIHAHSSELGHFYNNQKKLLQYILDFMLTRSNCLIALSNRWKDFYRDICHVDESKITVLPNPVEIPKKNEKSISTKVRFIYLGIMNENKGALRVLEAIKRLPDNLKEQLRITLAGNGEIEKVRNFVTDNSLDRYVTVLSWVNEEKRKELLLNSDVFILPSRNEGLPMAMLEAMAYSLPIIISPVGGIPEFVKDGHNGFLANPGDISSIENSIVKLLENMELRLEMGKNARRTVEALDVRIYMKKLSDLYSRLV